MAFEDQIEEAYKIVIRSSNLGGTPGYFKERIVASVPEEGIVIDGSSTWDAPFEAGGEAITTALQSLGIQESTQIRALAKQIWKGVDPVSVSMNLKFMTHESPFNDVVRPAMSIRVLPLPYVGQEDGVEGWFLNPPVVPPEENISVMVSGRSIVFDKILPVSASVSFSGTFCKEPDTLETWPVSAEVDFEFIASEAPVRDQNLGGIQIGVSG